MELVVLDMANLDLEVDSKTMKGTVSIGGETVVKTKVRSLEQDVMSHNLMSALVQKGTYDGKAVALFDSVTNRVCTGREKSRLVWQLDSNIRIPSTGIPATVLQNGELVVQEQQATEATSVSWSISQQLLDALDS